ncbi:MAG: hypothetical protein AB7F76_03620 [Parvibaculaceae bacterium]
MLRLFRTSAFRLASAYAAVTAVAFLLLFLFTHWISIEALDRQFRSTVEVELADLVAERHNLTQEEFVLKLNDQLSIGGSPFLFYYSDQKNAKLAGNLDRVLPVVGWKETPFDPNNPHLGNQSPTDDDHQLLSLGANLPDGSFLLVGMDEYRVLTAQEAIVTAFLWASIAALALAIIVGATVSARF